MRPDQQEHDQKRAEWWLWLVKCGFSHALAQRELKYQPKMPPHILNQVLRLINTLRILIYASTERDANISLQTNWNTFNECLSQNSAHPYPWTAAGCKCTSIVFAPLTAWRRDLWAGYLLLTSIPVRSWAERERDDVTAHLFRCQINQELLSCYCFAHCNKVPCSA